MSTAARARVTDTARATLERPRSDSAKVKAIMRTIPIQVIRGAIKRGAHPVTAVEKAALIKGASEVLLNDHAHARRMPAGRNLSTRE
jgi:hypothetical protein